MQRQRGLVSWWFFIFLNALLFLSCNDPYECDPTRKPPQVASRPEPLSGEYEVVLGMKSNVQPMANPSLGSLEVEPTPVSLNFDAEARPQMVSHLSTGALLQVLGKTGEVLFEKPTVNFFEVKEKVFGQAAHSRYLPLLLMLEADLKQFQVRENFPRYADAETLRLVYETVDASDVSQFSNVTPKPKVFDFKISEIQSGDAAKVQGVLVRPKLEKIHFTGKIKNRLNIILLGDGYTEKDLARFRQDSDYLAAHFLNVEPFVTYKGAINIWRVITPSREAGARCDDGKFRLRDNVYGSSFPVACLNAVFGTSFNDRAAWQTSSTAIWEAQRLIRDEDGRVAQSEPYILIHSTKYGGAAIFWPTQTNSVPSRVFPHEMGHAFGGLGDEYVAPTDFCYFFNIFKPNISIKHSSASSVKWSQWIDAGTPIPTPKDFSTKSVGLFAGASNCDGLYRPARHCKMRDEIKEFCPVCREQLVLRLFDVIRPFDREIEVTKLNRKYTFDAPVVLPTFASRWIVDDKVVQENVTYKPLTTSLALGEHTVRLQVQDFSKQVRRDRCHLFEMQSRKITIR